MRRGLLVADAARGRLVGADVRRRGGGGAHGRARLPARLPRPASAPRSTPRCSGWCAGWCPVPTVLEVRPAEPDADQPGVLVTSWVDGVRGDVLLPTLAPRRAGPGRCAALGELAADLGGMPMPRAGTFVDAGPHGRALRPRPAGVRRRAGARAGAPVRRRARRAARGRGGGPDACSTRSTGSAWCTATSTPRTCCSTPTRSSSIGGARLGVRARRPPVHRPRQPAALRPSPGLRRGGAGGYGRAAACRRRRRWRSPGPPTSSRSSSSPTRRSAEPGRRTRRPAAPRYRPAARSRGSPTDDLDPALVNGLGDPRDHLVEHLVERGRGLEAEHARSALSTAGTRRCTSCSNGRRSRTVERLVAVDLAPDHLGQLEHRGRLGRRQVEVLVERASGAPSQSTMPRARSPP